MCITEIVRHLKALVACDTQNPPRDIDRDSPIMRYCRSVVDDGFEAEVSDHGSGHVSFYAVRGKPKVLFNVHLDTVPSGPGWDSDPLKLQIGEDRAVGRGACDIKGAAACLLAIADSRPDHMAVLFTTDEEGSEGRCVRAFCESSEIDRFEQVVVAEPTGCEAILGHRGFLSVEGRFHGVPGHSSETRALKDNAIHQMSRWACAALDLARRNSLDDGSRTCLNLGFARGGTANNVIAGEAVVSWSARLCPGSSNREFLQELKACAPTDARVEWMVEHDGEPLPASGRSDAAARQFAERHGLPLAAPVDFWTEASIFSEFRRAALVLGPGHIAQAHIVNEWVELAQLERACEFYSQLIANGG